MGLIRLDPVSEPVCSGPATGWADDCTAGRAIKVIILHSAYVSHLTLLAPSALACAFVRAILVIREAPPLRLALLGLSASPSHAPRRALAGVWQVFIPPGLASLVDTYPVFLLSETCREMSREQKFGILIGTTIKVGACFKALRESDCLEA